MDATVATDAERFGMAGLYRAFMDYARAFYTGRRERDYHLALKLEHSLNVFRHACRIAEEEAAVAAVPDRARGTRIAALFHDLGRFAQFSKYGTFNDARSENHARLALREVKRLGLFSREERRVRQLALTAVLTHNRFALAPGMDADALAVARAVRDADKLDIMRIMAGHLTAEGPVDSVVALGVKSSPEATPVILRAVMERRLGSYADLATTTDFKLLVCGWLYDLNYAHSRRQAAVSGHLRVLFDSLPRREELLGFIRQYGDDLAACAQADSRRAAAIFL
ncbi:MAG: HD domain-containing protein [Deltaproteobacteria bacterium]|jgi:hypothetical protein|nr:HD domain-containing protein [Deltaproteobacteria bacterium]